MPSKCKNNPRRTQHTRTRFTQKLNRTPETPRVLRKVWLPNGEQAAIAECNGVFLLGLFDASEKPLQARPAVFTGQNGQKEAFKAISLLAGKKIHPVTWR
tara:strand:- start:1372 stop:1671 length:300 start_codon:yes stop_codon:yes gene_type:complete